MRRALLALAAAAFALASAGADAAETPPAPARTGFRLLDATAASVNGEIIFLSDVAREACFDRCGAFPGEPAGDGRYEEARKRLVYKTLILQEQRKLSLGTIDNAALAKTAAEVSARMSACTDPCARSIGEGEARGYVSSRFLVSEFLDKRVTVFIEVSDEEVQRTIGRRASNEGKDPDSYSEDEVRAGLRREKSSLEIRNWYYKAASNARIFMSPMEEI